MNEEIKKKILDFTPLIIILLIVIGIIIMATEDKLTNEPQEEINVEKIEFKTNNLNLNYGEESSLEILVSSQYASNKNIIWEVSNEELINIDSNGKITILKNQDAEVTITAKTKDGKTSSQAKITINKIENPSNEITPPKDETQPPATPNEPTTPVQPEPNEPTTPVQPEPNEPEQPVIPTITNISFKDKEINLKYNETKKLNLIITPSTVNADILWSSNNSNLVSVDNSGNIKVLKNETSSATITATTKDNKHKATIKINTTKIDTTIYAESLKIVKSTDTIILNNDNKNLTLTVQITPTNTTNKEVTWTSSNTNVATVNNGVVTAKALGSTQITATTKNGIKTSTTIYVKKNVIAVIGASQVTRMNTHVTSYKSQKKTNYKVSDGTLLFLHASGKGMDYQTTTQITTLKNKIKPANENINYYVLFPLIGNTIQDFTCSSISSTNTDIVNYVKKYDSIISDLNKEGYKTKGYVISMHPVKVSQSNSSSVVVNENKNACTKNYRSNRKYYHFNQAVKTIMTSYPSIKYIETFTDIMGITDPNKNYTYKITYNTDDGVHWDENTTKVYVKMMLDKISEL